MLQKVQMTHLFVLIKKKKEYGKKVQVKYWENN